MKYLDFKKYCFSYINIVSVILLLIGIPINLEENTFNILTILVIVSSLGLFVEIIVRKFWLKRYFSISKIFPKFQPLELENNKKFSIIFNILFVISSIITFIIYCTLILVTIIALSSPKVDTNYDKAYNNIKRTEKITHFPKSIPTSAKNIEVYEYSKKPDNGEVLMLKFKIDKDYINQELKKHEFLNASTKLGTKQEIYNIPQMTKKFNPENYTYYVLKDDENKLFYKKYFPYFSGIGISKNKDEILYYYFNPGD